MWVTAFDIRVSAQVSSSTCQRLYDEINFLKLLLFSTLMYCVEKGHIPKHFSRKVKVTPVLLLDPLSHYTLEYNQPCSLEEHQSILTLKLNRTCEKASHSNRKCSAVSFYSIYILPACSFICEDSHPLHIYALASDYDFLPFPLTVSDFSFLLEWDPKLVDNLCGYVIYI